MAKLKALSAILKYWPILLKILPYLGRVMDVAQHAIKESRDDTPGITAPERYDIIGTAILSNLDLCPEEYRDYARGAGEFFRAKAVGGGDEPGPPTG